MLFLILVLERVIKNLLESFITTWQSLVANSRHQDSPFGEALDIYNSIHLLIIGLLGFSIPPEFSFNNL